MMFDILASAFVSQAWAADKAPQGGSPLATVIMVGGFVLLLYLVVWRPQSKQAKEKETLMKGLSKGDEVITAGGIAGTITRLKDNFVVLSLGENLEITVQKTAITAVLPKGTLKSI